MGIAMVTRQTVTTRLRGKFLPPLVMALVFLLPLRAQQRAGFGPVTLGKRLPVLPACGAPNSEGQYQQKGPCWVRNGEDVLVFHVITDTPLTVVRDDCGPRDRRSCPVGQVSTDIAESSCQKMLARLTRQFGTPAHHAVPSQNAFGAHWTRHDYLWKLASGDMIYYATHPDRNGGNCRLEASTLASRAAKNKD
jgi:hypothetical protein